MHQLAYWSFRDSNPVFKTSKSTNALFLYFRQISQTFVAALVSYVYDVAIGGNFDQLLARLVESESSSAIEKDDNPNTPSTSQGGRVAFANVNVLVEYHTTIMDNILTACFLGSGQEAGRDALQACLQIILEFGTLISNVKRGRMKEYDGVVLIEGLLDRFRVKMMELVS